jgi:tetratricopeptide (TPR) repeat protein
LNSSGADSALRELALRCLAIDPANRPDHAGALAQELAAHSASVNERLRQETLVAERHKVLILEERKRRKLWTGLSAVALLALVSVAVAGFIWQNKRAEYRQRLALTQQQVTGDLARARGRLLAGDVASARLDWNRAAGREGLDALPHLRDARDQLERDLEMTDELDRVRIQRSTPKGGAGLDNGLALKGYENAFSKYGLNLTTGDVDAIARQMNDSAVRLWLTAAVHDWAVACQYLIKDEKDNHRRHQWRTQRDRLLEVAGRVNSNTAFQPIYDPDAWNNLGTLDPFSTELNVAEVSPQLLVMLGESLSEKSREELWRSAQRKHPDDFWLNYELGRLLHQRKRDEDAIGFHRAALAIRPNVAAAHNNLGVCFLELDRLDEALSTLNEAVRLDPEYALPHTNLASVWLRKKEYDKAIEAARESIRLYPEARSWTNLAQGLLNNRKLDEAKQAAAEALKLSPDLVNAHFTLGMIYDEEGDYAKAVESYRRVVELDPNNPKIKEYLGRAHYHLANDLKNRHGYPSAISHYRQAIKLQPEFASAHLNLGVTLKRAGDVKGAITSYREALRLEPRAQDGHFNLGLALLANGDYVAAESSFRTALELKPNDSHAYRNLGVTLAKLERFSDALPHFQKAVAIDPEYAAAHVGLGLTLRQLGQYRDSLAHLQQANELGVKTDEGQEATRQWIKEVARLVELEDKLPRILAGEEKLTDAAEGLELAELCFNKKRFAASARLFSETFTSHPDLAGDVFCSHRQQAICAAALTGCGRSEDAAELDEFAKAKWRQQSLEWLRAVLTSCTDKLAQVPHQADQAELRKIRELIQNWRQAPQLAVVREPAELAQLPAEEQTVWKSFWMDVQTAADRLQSARTK